MLQFRTKRGCMISKTDNLLPVLHSTSGSHLCGGKKGAPPLPAQINLGCKPGQNALRLSVLPVF